MKALVFDSGPIISLALNNLLWVLEELKKHYEGDFLAPPAVYQELVERPMNILRYRFEAYQTRELFNKGVLKIGDGEVFREMRQTALSLAGRLLYAKHHPISVIHEGDAEVLALAYSAGAEAVVMDERTTRVLLEEPDALRKIISSKLHTKVKLEKKALKEFLRNFSGCRVIRSVELVAIAYELGILDRYSDNPQQPEAKEAMLEASLWALKLKGATVSQNEIEKILKVERALR